MNQPSYWGIMPASVRYADIPAGAKLLYVEITALERAKGHCWATNAYFAELYQTHEKTISRWFSALERGGHILVTSQKENNGWRIIKTVAQEVPPCNPSVTPVEQKCPPRVTKMLHPVEQNCYTPCNKNATHNNTSNNSTSRIAEGEGVADAPKQPAIFVKPSIEEVVVYASESQVARVEAEKFWYYHDARGWMMGKHKMKSWKSAFQTWRRNIKGFVKSQKGPAIAK